MKPVRLHGAVFLVSAVGIAYQVGLTRILSIAQWHHFAYMVISIAMLGFGASGTVLALGRTRMRGHEDRLLSCAAGWLSLSLPACFVLCQYIPFETFLLASEPRQIVYLLALYLVLAWPFFLVSTCITLGFFLAPGHAGRMYAVNMLGSGIGALSVVAMLHTVAPSAIPFLLTIPAGSAYAWAVSGRPWARTRAFAMTAIVVAMIVGPRWVSGLEELTRIQVSQYKGLSYALLLPDAKVVVERSHPLAVVTAVSSKRLRETPGQISNYPMEQLGALPEQVGLYFDAGGVSPLSRFTGDLQPFAYLDYVTSAVAYHLVEQPSVLVIGAGGGADVLSALLHEARHVTALEINPAVFRLCDNELRDFGGALYRHPLVTPVVADGRGYLQSHEQRFDLIQIALLDSFNASAAGTQALDESYLYTVEALALYLERLNAGGVLAITRWLKTPPRDALKIFATAVEACERAGIHDPAQHLAFIRSWNTGTVLVSKAPLNAAAIQAVRNFCRERGLDRCYLPGIRAQEANRYTLLEEPCYYDFAQQMLFGDREALYRGSLFYLRPGTDDRPHFFRFFKWAALPRLWQGMGLSWMPFVEWGYVTLAATLVQGVAVSAVLILLPLTVLARRPAVRRKKRWVVLYFAALGLAYLFLEIAFIQRFMLFLAYPVYALAVVLTAFLCFSGLGSLLADRAGPMAVRSLRLAVMAIGLFSLAYVVVLPVVFRAGAGWPDAVKIGGSILLIAPLAFAMGLPFPLGLQRVARLEQRLLPWAWGINGCGSVISASLATLIGMHLGFRCLVLAALILYGLAALAFVPLSAESPCADQQPQRPVA